MVKICLEDRKIRNEVTRDVCHSLRYTECTVGTDMDQDRDRPRRKTLNKMLLTLLNPTALKQVYDFTTCTK